MTSVIGDIRDENGLAIAMRDAHPEIVIHMAAQSTISDSYINPTHSYAINVMGTVNVLEAARLTQDLKVIINVTTDKCYEARDEDCVFYETDPQGGNDPYSNSKACSELVTLAYKNSFFNPDNYSEHGVAIASVRNGNVIGGGDWGKNRLIPDMIRAVTIGEPVSIRSPHAIRPWQYVLEPLSAYLLLAERLYTDSTKYSGAWNLSANDEDVKPVQWVANKLTSLWGEGASWILDLNPQAPETYTTKLDCTKANQQLGWYPRWDIETCLAKLVSWHKAYNDNQNMRDLTIRQIASFIEDNKKQEVEVDGE